MSTWKITHTETHYTNSKSREEALRMWNAGELDGSGLAMTEVEELRDPLKTYTILSGTLYEIEASSKKEAMEKLAKGVDIEEGEAHSDFYGSQPCEYCAAEWGWHKDDEAGITFEGLKKAQNEAILRGITYAMEYLEDINYHDGANVLAEYLAFLEDPQSVEMSDWQSNFHAGHTLYSTECEG